MKKKDGSEIDIKINDQKTHCSNCFLSKTAYYKGCLGAVITILFFALAIFGGVVAWSYGPIKDIATLKAESRVQSEKLDTIIKLYKN